MNRGGGIELGGQGGREMSGLFLEIVEVLKGWQNLDSDAEFIWVITLASGKHKTQ